jgi:RNA polymerase sigma-70 factor (ECF subfamily)
VNIEKLIKRSAQGNSKAQKVLYEKYIGIIYAVVFRYLKNEADVEDILLQSYLKIFLKLKDFRFVNEKAFVGWIKKIAINEALMFKRKEFSAMYRVENVEDVENLLVVSPEIVEEKELIELIEQLPDGYKTVFLLHVVDGYSHKEIGENLNIAESTSRSQFFKARNLLQKKLGNYYGTAMGT